jgi:hypothetical protein
MRAAIYKCLGLDLPSDVSCQLTEDPVKSMENTGHIRYKQ